MDVLTGSDGLLEIFNCALLGLEAVALLMMKPTKLLQNLGMIGITLQNSAIGGFGVVILTHF